MSNAFYQDFDRQRLPDTKIPEDDCRNAFQIERDRITFSSAFRQLQSKTQVFQSGQYDFYRTRLTHSIEVAKIGRAICEYLRAKSEHLTDNFFIDPDLTEAICLAHDIGHPPFGHIGERKLNELMKPHGGFEGNAQTLRIVTELIYERPDGTKGIDPTRAFLDGVMKYKELWERTSKDNAPPAHHFIYEEQAKFRDFVFDKATIPAEPSTAKTLNKLKSIECQIMDWADDTAYSLHDIADAIHASYITVGSITEWADKQQLNDKNTALIETLLDKIKKNTHEHYFSTRIGEFVESCTLKPRSNFLSEQTNRHAFDLSKKPEIEAECELYKKIARDLIFYSTQFQKIEFKGGYILERLFKAFSENYSKEGLRILPSAFQKLIDGEETESGPYRQICDYMASLTDGQAMRTYKNLFEADFSSISKLL